MLNWLLPDFLPPGLQLILIVASFLTSALTASFGIGGGVSLLAIMGLVLPVKVLIPLHGLVQLGSNAGRAVVLMHHVHWPVLGAFALGSVIGAIGGGQIIITLPESLLRLFLGLFVLIMVWLPKVNFSRLKSTTIFLTGVIATFLTMFLGATGPVVAAILGPQFMSRQIAVGTLAVCLSLQHLLKVIIFGLIGFAYGPWLGLIGAMIVAGFLGTLVGAKLLVHMNEAWFRKGFRIVLSALALNLIWNAVEQMM